MEFSITGDPCLPSHDAFSFCAETIQPVMLYELGFQAARGAVLVVGSHLHYERRRDVVAQLARAWPGATALDSLPATVHAAAKQLLVTADRPYSRP